MSDLLVTMRGMGKRIKEILAALDLVIMDLERLRPATCQAAVEQNWNLRKLQVARRLVVEAAGRPAAFRRKAGKSSQEGGRTPVRLRVE